MGRVVPVHTARCLGAAPGAEGTVGHGVASVGALLSPPGAAGQGTCPRWTFSFAPQIEDETQVSRATQGEQDNYEMHVRAANIVSHQVEGTVWAPEAFGPYWVPGGQRGKPLLRRLPLRGGLSSAAEGGAGR